MGFFLCFPNCKYRHILPEGFVLESEKKALKAAEKKNQISLEDLIERERAALGPNQTKKPKRKLLERKKSKKKPKKPKLDKLKDLQGVNCLPLMLMSAVMMKKLKILSLKENRMKMIQTS